MSSMISIPNFDCMLMSVRLHLLYIGAYSIRNPFNPAQRCSPKGHFHVGLTWSHGGNRYIFEVWAHLHTSGTAWVRIRSSRSFPFKRDEIELEPRRQYKQQKRETKPARIFRGDSGPGARVSFVCSMMTSWDIYWAGWSESPMLSLWPLRTKISK